MIREDAIYARQSAMRDDSISIESQIVLCESEIKSNTHRTYVDQGFSGKNTERPQFQEMMAAVRNGEIKRIICYKLDRCSRSVRDFVSMIEVLEQYEVEFISFTEKFDTSSPMGRAMLNICIVFAQLERETIQMRVEDAYKSMSQKGFYMGGRIPYGFNREQYLLNGKKTSRYTHDEEQSFAVRMIYETFHAPKANTGDVISVLTACNIKNPETKDGSWRSGRIHQIICNPIYVKADLAVYHFFQENGAIIHNSPDDFDGFHGCYLYEDKSEGLPRKILRIAGHHLVLAPHEGIVSSDLWLSCRKKFKFTGDRLHDNSVKRHWLAGKIKCMKCGYALVVRSTPGKPTRNYVCSRSTRTYGICEGIGKLPAEDLEEIVLSELRKKLMEFQTLSIASPSAPDPKTAELTAELEKLETETNNLLQSLMLANSVLAKYINERVSLLDKKKTLLLQELKKHQTRAAEKEHALQSITNYMAQWESLTVSDKMKVVDTLIEKISVSEKQIQIQWKI